jgi:hypothetical protein
MSSPPPPTVWEARNAMAASVLAPLLVLTGALGFTLPARWALLSGAPAYNLFHGVVGMAGIWLVIRFGGRGAVAFNLAFGLVDLYQALAGAVDLFPAALFAYRPLDDVLHVVLGRGLVGLGVLGRGPGAAAAPGGRDPAPGGPGIG